MVNTFVLILIVVIILGILGIVYKINYNKLMTTKIKVDEAENIINDTIKKRYDGVIRTAHLVKKNLNLDIELFNEVEKLKVQNVSNNDLDNKINDAYKTILQLKEDYPNLIENRGFQDILEEFKENTELIEATKSFYDNYAKNLNDMLKTFPCNLIGKIHHIKKVEFYNTILTKEEVVID